MTEEHVSQLKQINDQFAQTIQSKNEYAALKVDEEFHQVIVDIARNPYIHNVLESLQAHVRRHFFYNSIVLEEKSIEEHDQIIEAMRKGNKEKASATMKENWLRTLKEFE